MTRNLTTIVVWMWTGVAFAAPQADLKASRLTGVAPLSVFFDASGTTDTDSSVEPFHELAYRFDFGDERGQLWAHSGMPKNQHVGGPMIGHVFDVPGTYEVRLRVEDASGAFSERSVTVTVDDPDVVFSGFATICVSSVGDFGGCPAGAEQRNSLPVWADDTRVLLRRGESFNALTINSAVDNLFVGPFGAGTNRPSVQFVRVGSKGKPSANHPDDVFPDDIVIQGLDILNGLFIPTGGSRILIYDNTLSDSNPAADHSISVGMTYARYAHPSRILVDPSDFYAPHEIFIVENVLHGSLDSDEIPRQNFRLHLGHYSAVMGNETWKSWEHNVRIYSMSNSVFSHNWIKGYHAIPAGKATTKVHSGSATSYYNVSNPTAAGMGLEWISDRNVFSYNRFGSPGANNYSGIAVAPQYTGAMEGLEDIVIEYSQFDNPGMLFGGRRMSSRGNARTNGQALTGGGTGFHLDAAMSGWDGPYLFNLPSITPAAPTGVPVALCGNGTLDGGEACDGANFGAADCTTEGFMSGTLGCTSACTLNTTQCQPFPNCGNGTLDTGEACDGANFGAADCTTEGFMSGTLGCSSACALDTSQCQPFPNCGNGVLDAGEECDGALLGGATCADLNLPEGTMQCTAACLLDSSECRPGREIEVEVTEVNVQGGCTAGAPFWMWFFRRRRQG